MAEGVPLAESRVNGSGSGKESGNGVESRPKHSKCQKATARAPKTRALNGNTSPSQTKRGRKRTTTGKGEDTSDSTGGRGKRGQDN